MQTLHIFESHGEAVNYRREHGTGGWIFASDNGSAVLFPAWMTPSQVMTHPITSKQGGTLIP